MTNAQAWDYAIGINYAGRREAFSGQKIQNEGE